MNLSKQEYLRWAEESGKLVIVDTESTGLNGDYNSLLVVSAKPYGKPVVSFFVTRPGDDRELTKVAIAFLRQFDVFVAHFGKYHDVPLLISRNIFHRLPAWQPRYEIDTWLFAKHNLKLSRNSQAHIARWLGTKEQKMDLGPQEWNDVLSDPKKNLPTLVARCESDVKTLEEDYAIMRPYIPDVARRQLV